MTSKQVRLIFGGSFFALLLAYCEASFYVWFYPPGSDGGRHGSGDFGKFFITYIDPKSPAKDLRPGDKIIAINRVKESLLANAHAAPQAVIDRLLQTSEDWASGKAADDDMTFVDLKMK
jgi:hypothetical protein